MQSYIDKINELIKEITKNEGNIFILEAGCGSSSRFDFGENAYISGVDISQNQLNKNKVIQNRIHGDIQKIELQYSSFDIIICWEVLEHVKRPELALKNFVRWLKNDGLIIIGVPNVMSLKGLVTKLTPYKFHYWCNKHIFKWKSVPFPAYLRMFISPRSLKNFAEENNLFVQWTHFDNEWIKTLKKSSLLIYSIYFAIGFILKILSCGFISIKKTGFIIVYRKV